MASVPAESHARPRFAGLESPARADASPPDYPPKDGRRAWIELTAFQRDCLEAVARRERDGKRCYPSGITLTLERRYPTVSRARLEPNLRALVGRELLAERDGPDDRVTAYGLTGAGRALLIQRAERLAVLCDLRGDVVGMVAESVAQGDSNWDG